MKKKISAILIILVLATVGLFAIDSPSPAVGLLKGDVGEYLVHGFNNGTIKYSPTIEFTNVLTVEEKTTKFKYGYETNAPGGFTFTMSISDFINQSSSGSDAAPGVVKIKSVTGSGSGLAAVDGALGSYTVFSPISGAAEKDKNSGEIEISITPAVVGDAESDDHTGDIIGKMNTTNALPGPYISTISFSIVASK